MTLKQLAQQNRQIAQDYSAPQPVPHAERIRRALRSVWGREPANEDVQKQIDLSNSLIGTKSR